MRDPEFAKRNGLARRGIPHLTVRGENNPMCRPEQRKRVSENNPMHDPEVARKQNESARPARMEYIRTHPEEVYAKAAHAASFSRFSNTRIEQAIDGILEERKIDHESQGTLSFLPGNFKFHRFDFCLPGYKLVIEADGCYYHGCPIHNPNDHLEQFCKDRCLDQVVEEAGWIMLRFWGHQIREDIVQVEKGILEVVGRG